MFSDVVGCKCCSGDRRVLMAIGIDYVERLGTDLQNILRQSYE